MAEAEKIKTKKLDFYLSFLSKSDKLDSRAVELPYDCDCASEWSNSLKKIESLNILDCFIDDKRCIHISYHVMDFVQQK